jgi:hypothetical protein
MSFWAAENPAQAGEWTQSLPPGDLRESAIQAYVDAALHWSPDLATQQAATIADDSARNRKLQDCLTQWLAISPASARAWLKSAHLPREFKEQYLISKADAP